MNLNIINHEVNLLRHLDGKKADLGLNQEGVLQVKKRSCIPNFLRRIVYKIFCIPKPLNPDLDKATLNVIQKIYNLNLQNRNDVTAEQKGNLKAALRNLRMIVKNNGGAHEQELMSVQVIVAGYKVQNLDPVKKVIEKKKILANGALFPFAPHEFKLNNLTPNWMREHVPTLNPKTISYIVEKSLQKEDFYTPLNEEFLPMLFSVLIHEPVKTESLAAFVKALPVLDAEDQLIKKLKENVLTAEVMDIIERNLKPENANLFK